MVEYLYWLEPEQNWRSRGYANNLKLSVNYDKQEYKLQVGTYFPKGSDDEIIVASKGNINKHVGFLEKYGFKKDLT
jgi:hypothetical protein